MNHKIIRSTTGEPIFIIEEEYGKIIWNNKDKEISMILPEEDPVLSPVEIEFRTLRKAYRELVECIMETSLGKFLILIVDLLASALNEWNRK